MSLGSDIDVFNTIKYDFNNRRVEIVERPWKHSSNSEAQWLHELAADVAG